MSLNFTPTQRLFRNPLVMIAAILLISWSLFQCARYFLPLEMSELSSRGELWLNGVSEVNAAALHGYEKNHCVSASDCTCISLIHGLGDEAKTWKKILIEPKDQWIKPVRLIAWNLPGSGKSPPPQSLNGYRVRELAGAIQKAQMAIPECERWMVVGNSLGGAVASWLAMDHSQKTFKLVLVGSSGLKALRESKSTLFIQAQAQAQTGDAGQEVSTEQMVEILKDFQKKAYFKPRELPPQVWKAAAERMKSSNTAVVRKAQTPDDDLDTYLPAIRVPTLVFRGEADQIVPREISQEMARLIRGAVYRETPQCGHLPQKECPAALTQVMNEMLRFGVM